MPTRVDLELAAGVAWITLDGPERRNALDLAAAQSMREQAQRLADLVAAFRLG